MAFGKTEEEKARRQAEKEAAQEAARQQADAAQQRAAAARAREAYLRTPLGQADEALERGDMFFQFHAPLSKLQGRATDWTFGATTSTTTHRATDKLRQIEELGCRLEHFASVFVETEKIRAARCCPRARSPAPAAMSKASTCFVARRVHEAQTLWLL
jgi:hypothetical protein